MKFYNNIIMTSIFDMKYILILGTLFLITTSCNNKTESQQEEAMTEGQSEHLIEITEKQFESSDFMLGKVTDQLFTTEIQALGNIHLPMKNRAMVSAYMGGFVSNIDLIPGQYVRRGSRLFTLSNPDYIDLQQEYLESSGLITYLQEEYDRQQTLAEEKISAKKNLLKAESDLNREQAKLASLKEKLRLIGINVNELTPDNLTSSIGIYAPVSGYVSEVKAISGMFLQPGVEAVEIMDVSHIHLELRVLEKDVPNVKVGQMVKFYTPHQQDKIYEADVHLIERVIDEDRMMNIHCHLDEETQKELVPGMYVEGSIMMEDYTGKALPSEAVVEVDNAYYVLEKVGDGKYSFEMKRVETGHRNDDYVEVLSGINTNADYLTKGAYYMISGEGGE